MDAAAEYLPNDKHFATKAIHVGQEPEQWKSLAVVPHITLSTTFKQPHPGQPLEFEYGRGGNPTRSVLESCMASLEGAKYCAVFSSGLAALSAITNMLKTGDHILAMDDLYGGTNRFFRRISEPQGITTSFINAKCPDTIGTAIQPNTRLIWIETPTNPTLKVVDIKQVVSVIKKNRSDIIIAVDNTFLSSYFQRPLELGADISYSSCTKYINGHSDVVMGTICMNDEKLHEKLRFIQYGVGATPSPFDCYLVNRSLKTLKIRMEEHQKNAMIIARFLEGHPCVIKVNYPGLESHPDYELAKRQQFGCSGMISFYLKGSLNESNKFLNSIKVFTLAESLGGFESLAELPYSMTHASIEEKERISLGVTDNLIRLSVGLENVDDLMEDLDQALRIACSA